MGPSRCVGQRAAAPRSNACLFLRGVHVSFRILQGCSYVIFVWALRVCAPRLCSLQESMYIALLSWTFRVCSRPCVGGKQQQEECFSAPSRASPQATATATPRATIGKKHQSQHMRLLWLDDCIWPMQCEPKMVHEGDLRRVQPKKWTRVV